MNKWVVVSCALLVLAGVSSGHRHGPGENRGDHHGKHRGEHHGDHHHGFRDNNITLVGGDLSTCGFVASEEWSFRRLALRDEPFEFEGETFGKAALSMCRPLEAVPKAEKGWCDNSTQICIMRSSGSAISAGRYPGMSVSQKPSSNASAPTVLELKFSGGDHCGSSSFARMSTTIEMTCAWKEKFLVKSAVMSASGCELRLEVDSRAACSLNASRAWWAKHHAKHSDDSNDDDDDEMEDAIMEMQMSALLAMFLMGSMICTLCLCCCACVQRRRAVRQRELATSNVQLEAVSTASSDEQYPAHQAPVFVYPQVPMMYAAPAAPLNPTDQQQFAAFLTPQEQMEQYYAMSQIQQQQQQQQPQYVYVPAQAGRATNESSLI